MALHRLPGNVSYDEGAFTESVGVALYAIERANLNPGDNVAIVGPGAIGLIALQIARKAKGAKNVILLGTNDERLEMGRTLGADRTINSRSSQDPVGEARGKLSNQNLGFDAAIEFAGTGIAAEQSIALVRRGGRVVLGGATSPGNKLSIDLSSIVRGHLDITGALANPKWVCEEGIALISRGLVDVHLLISGNYSLHEFEKAFKMFQSRVGGGYRVMIHP